MNTSLSSESTSRIFARLQAADEAFSRAWPGPAERRQPVHTVYGGAHLFKAETCRKLGELARRSLATYAPDGETLARIFEIENRSLAETVRLRIEEKLVREPVEDFRIDFEDGYGHRTDREEDSHAESAAREVARGLAADTLPPFLGIRIKPLSSDLRSRAVRTLDLFLTTLAAETGGTLPPHFVITLPKVTMPESVAALADVLDLLEPRLGLPAGALKIEFMVEMPQLIADREGRCPLRHVVDQARGRAVAAHVGAYDYLASCGVTAEVQHLQHPVCDHLRRILQVALAGSGIFLSDGATNILPIPRHARPETAGHLAENRAIVERAWKLHYRNVRHALASGFYQGWDLHPAQLPARYAALHVFFLEHLENSSRRLRNFVEQAAQATRVGEIFDDAATGQGLLNTFLRAMQCGAIPESEASPLTGLTLEELRSLSFVRIIRDRIAQTPK
jgi:citrate lyase beta subunit